MADLAELELRISSVEARVAAKDLENLTRQGAAAERQAGLTGRAHRSLDRLVFSPLATTVARLSREITLLAGAYVGLSAIRRATSDALAFSTAMAEVSTIVDTASTNIDQLSNSVLDLARAQGQSEIDLARGLYQTISSGVTDAAKAFDVLTTASRLAIAGVATTAQTVDLLTSSINAFSVQGLTAERASDVLFRTVQLGKTKVNELADSFGRVLPLGAALGVSFEELSAFLAALTLNGLDTAESATSLRGVLRAMLNVTEDGQAIIDEFGLQFTPASVRANGLAGTLVDLDSKIGNNAAALRELFPEIRGLVGVLSVLNDDGVRFASLLDKITNSAGAAGEAFDKQIANPAKRLSILINGLRLEFSQAFGRSLLDGLERAIAQMGGFEAALNAVSEVGQTLGSVIGESFRVVVELVGKAIDAFAVFIDQVGSADQIEDRLRSGFTALLNSISSVIDIITEEIRFLIEQILFIPKYIEQARASVASPFTTRIFDVDAEAEIAKLEQIDAAIAKFQADQQNRIAAQVDPNRIAEDFKENLFSTALPDFGGKRFKPAFDLLELDYDQILAQADDVRQKIRDRIGTVKLEIQGDDPQAFKKIQDEQVQSIERFSSNLEQLRTDLVTNVTSIFQSGPTDDLDLIEEQITSLQAQIERNTRLGLDVSRAEADLRKLSEARDAITKVDAAPPSLFRGTPLEQEIHSEEEAIKDTRRELAGLRADEEKLAAVTRLPLNIQLELGGTEEVFRRLNQLKDVQLEVKIREDRIENLTQNLIELREQRDLLRAVRDQPQRSQRFDVTSIVTNTQVIDESIETTRKDIEKLLSEGPDALGEVGASVIELVTRLEKLQEVRTEPPKLSGLEAFAREIDAIIGRLVKSGDKITAESLFPARERAELAAQVRGAAEKARNPFSDLGDARTALTDSIKNVSVDDDLEAGRRSALALADAMVDVLDSLNRIRGSSDDARAELEELANVQFDRLERLRDTPLRLRSIREEAQQFSETTPRSFDIAPFEEGVTRSKTAQLAQIEREVAERRTLITYIEEELRSRNRLTPEVEAEIAEARALTIAYREQQRARLDVTRTNTISNLTNLERENVVLQQRLELLRATPEQRGALSAKLSIEADIENVRITESAEELQDKSQDELDRLLADQRALQAQYNIDVRFQEAKNELDFEIAQFTRDPIEQELRVRLRAADIGPGFEDQERELRERLNRLFRARDFADLGQGIAKAFTNGFEEIIFQANRLEDVLRGVAQRILQSFLEVFAFRPFENFLQASFANIGAGVGPGPGSSPALPGGGGLDLPVSNATGNAFSGSGRLLRFAQGAAFPLDGSPDPSTSSPSHSSSYGLSREARVLAYREGDSFGGDSYATSYGLGSRVDRSERTVERFRQGNPFINTVVSQPTIAPLALFGEAGPEAIVPLERGAAGLGVSAFGSGGFEVAPLRRGTGGRLGIDADAFLSTISVSKLEKVLSDRNSSSTSSRSDSTSSSTAAFYLGESFERSSASTTHDRVERAFESGGIFSSSSIATSADRTVDRSSSIVDRTSANASASFTDRTRSTASDRSSLREYRTGEMFSSDSSSNTIASYVRDVERSSLVSAYRDGSVINSEVISAVDQIERSNRDRERTESSKTNFVNRAVERLGVSVSDRTSTSTTTNTIDRLLSATRIDRSSTSSNTISDRSSTSSAVTDRTLVRDSSSLIDQRDRSSIADRRFEFGETFASDRASATDRLVQREVFAFGGVFEEPRGPLATTPSPLSMGSVTPLQLGQSFDAAQFSSDPYVVVPTQETVNNVGGNSATTTTDDSVKIDFKQTYVFQGGSRPSDGFRRAQRQFESDLRDRTRRIIRR